MPKIAALRLHLATDLSTLDIAAEVHPTDGHPVVFARESAHRSATRGHRRRVVFYGHYDVQPVDPLDLGRRRRSNRGSRRLPMGARRSSRAAPATTRDR
jgi:acetylornithine deacetylase/succinyl-diaminopimelate desuccinylase-like protein